MENNQPESVVPPTQKNGGNLGAVIAIVVIVLLLLAGGFYYFTSGIKSLNEYDDVPAITGDQELFPPTSTSDAIADIEADINNTDLSEVDQLLNDLDSELQAL